MTAPENPRPSWREDVAFAAWCLTPRELARSLRRTRWAHVRQIPSTAAWIAQEIGHLYAEPWKAQNR